MALYLRENEGYAKTTNSSPLQKGPLKRTKVCLPSCIGSSGYCDEIHGIDSIVSVHA